MWHPTFIFPTLVSGFLTDPLAVSIVYIIEKNAFEQQMYKLYLIGAWINDFEFELACFIEIN